MSEVWAPKPYQMDALKFVLGHANCGIFLDPGMGKTSVSLLELRTCGEGITSGAY
jgi:superfamily II DNA or RNA helicase